MDRRLNRMLPTGVGLLLTAVSGSAATFTWSGNGADDQWDTTANWQAVACANCYPDDADDDVTISGIFDVGLVKVGGTNLAIGDLTLSDTVILEDADGNDPTLAVQKVTISGAEGGTTIKIKQKATLETD
ncbi:MAG: hypothetical protein FLDDKLPJ_01227 [Phycisphaerae bacterium]|nr:hypothetical protein [Phycisphaerae bacterium]